MNNLISQYYSELDSNRFGIKVAKVDFSDQDPEKIINILKKEDFKLVISRVQCENIDLINLLESLDYSLKDIQITYKFDLSDLLIKDKMDSEAVIRLGEESDIPKLVEIAAESFNQYGHYYADKRLNKSRCEEIYVDWITRSLIDKKIADVVFVAELNNEVAGFLSFKEKMEGNILFSAGVQGAVSKKFRNQNVFKAIILNSLEWSNSMGHSWQEHNVLLTNYPVNRAFIRLGFVPFRSFLTFHSWL